MTKIKTMLRRGNKKLSKSIAVFDLPAIETCPNCTLCAKTCYAMKAQRQYPATLAHRQRNLELSKSDNFIGLIDTELSHIKLGLNGIRIIKNPIKYVRIHSSGDFYSREYFEKWVQIAMSNPTITFYAYTKTNWHRKHNLPANLIIHDSIIVTQLNYGNFQHIDNLVTSYGGFVCPDTLGHSGVSCGDTCTHCMTIGSNSQPIYFMQH